MRYTKGDLHIDRLLTNLSIGYSNPAYIADQIFPVVSTTKQSDLFVVYDQSHWFRNESTARATGTKSRRGGWTVGNDTFFAGRESYGHEIYDEDRDNADDNFQLDADAAAFTVDKIYMSRELDFAANFFKTGVWTTDKVGGTDFTKWSDYGSSTPLQDVTSWMDTVEGLIGREPNTMTIGKQVWSSLKWHPDLVDTIKYTQTGQVTMGMAAALFEIPKILVGKAIYTASPEGTAEASVTYSRIWGKNALLTYAPDRPARQNPSAGYIFTWARVPNSLVYIKRMRDEEREADIIEANGYWDIKVTGANAGLFGSAVVA